VAWAFLNIQAENITKHLSALESRRIFRVESENDILDTLRPVPDEILRAAGLKNGPLTLFGDNVFGVQSLKHVISSHNQNEDECTYDGISC
jgi:hypothetical protein